MATIPDGTYLIKNVGNPDLWFGLWNDHWGYYTKTELRNTVWDSTHKYTFKYHEDTGGYSISVFWVYTQYGTPHHTVAGHDKWIWFNNDVNFRNWKVVHRGNNQFSVESDKGHIVPSTTLIVAGKYPAMEWKRGDPDSSSKWTFHSIDDTSKPIGPIAPAIPPQPPVKPVVDPNPPVDPPSKAPGKDGDKDSEEAKKKKAEEYLLSAALTDASSYLPPSNSVVNLQNKRTRDRIVYNKPQRLSTATVRGQRGCADSRSEEWRIIPAGPYYRIINPKTKHALTWFYEAEVNAPVLAVRSFYPPENTPAGFVTYAAPPEDDPSYQHRPSKHDDNLTAELPDHLWEIKKILRDDAYLLIVPDTSLVVTLTDKEPNNIRLTYADGNDSQRWRIL